MCFPTVTATQLATSSPSFTPLLHSRRRPHATEHPVLRIMSVQEVPRIADLSGAKEAHFRNWPNSSIYYSKGRVCNILNVSNNHWVTTSNIGCKAGTVNVFDSIPNNSVSSRTKEQIAAILFSDIQLPVIYLLE